MEYGLRAHAHGGEHRDSLQPLIEQAFRTVSALTILIVVVALVYAGLYMFVW